MDWDDPVPNHVLEVWSQWRMELLILAKIHIPRCTSLVATHPRVSQSLLFSYTDLAMPRRNLHTALVMSKTKVSPIKRISIPRLVVTKLLCHVKKIPGTSVFAWTDSTVVLNWLTGNPRRFKTYVGNRISFIIDQISPERHPQPG